MRELAKYIEDSFGDAFHAKPIDNQELGKIPLFLKSNFKLYAGRLRNYSFIWAKVLDDSEITPDQLEKQSNRLKQFFQKPIVFVFDKLDSWHRRRLIDRNLAFVQPLKQIYIPEMFLQISDINRSENNRPVEIEKLSAPAQFAILYHLQVSSLEHKLFQEIAQQLEYSAMTVTRIFKELSGLDLILIVGGKEKAIQFKLQGKELWQKVMPLMNSPVREVWHADFKKQESSFMLAGETALSNYSMLASPSRNTFAIGKDQFRKLKSEGLNEGFDKKYGSERIEVWHYDPKLLSPENKVDKLSLYLSMNLEKDERIEAALEELLKNMKW